MKNSTRINEGRYLEPKLKKGFENIIISLDQDSVNPILLTNNTVSHHVSLFWKEIVERTDMDKYSILFFLRVQFEGEEGKEGDFMTVGRFYIIDKTDQLDEFIIRVVKNLWRL